MAKEPAITTLGEKGQVVIPKALREHLGLDPKTRFIVFGSGDTVVLRRLKLPDVEREWERVFAEVDAKGLGVSIQDVEEAVQARRRRRGRRTEHR